MTATESVLLPYQQRWVADPSPVKVAEKSRRIGLTWGEAADSALTAAEAAPAGDDTWYIGYNQEMAREFIETCGKWAIGYQLVVGELENVWDIIEDAGDVLEPEDVKNGIQAFRIRFASGHKIVALSSRPSNLRGKQGRVVLDEFAFHPEPGELLKAALALLIWGGRLIVISTHNGADNPFNQLVTDIRAGRKKFSLHRITFDEAIADGLYRRVCEKLEREWSPEGESAWREEIVEFYRPDEDEELFVQPRSAGGAYIPGTIVEACMDETVPLVRWCPPSTFVDDPQHLREAETRDWCEENLGPLLAQLNPNLLSYFGEDFGRSGDLTVVWPLQILPNLVRRVAFGLELRNVPYEQQKQVLFYVVDRLPRFVAGALDSRGNGHYLSEVARQRYGSGRIHQVMLSPTWYREQMPPYKAAYEDRTIIIPKDADVLADHRALRMDKGIAKIPDGARTSGATGQRHGDSAIAGAIALFATRSDVAEFDYTPAPLGSRHAERHPDDHGGAAGGFRGRGGY